MWREDEVLAGVAHEVEALHRASANPCLREWFYEGHVEVVADYAAKIAAREGVGMRVPVLAGLLHDIARTVMVEDEPQLTEDSERMAREVMARHGVSGGDADHVCAIMAVHSCRGEKGPTTAEGRVMVTADAMAHLMTDFYFILPFKGWLFGGLSFEAYKQWVLEKTARDFGKKLKFEVERKEAAPRVEALRVLFGAAGV